MTSPRLCRSLGDRRAPIPPADSYVYEALQPWHDTNMQNSSGDCQVSKRWDSYNPRIAATERFSLSTTTMSHPPCSSPRRRHTLLTQRHTGEATPRKPRDLWEDPFFGSCPSLPGPSIKERSAAII